MKHLTLFALMLTMVFSLSACGGGTSNNDLTNNPSAEQVKTALSTISNITTLEAATEDNDPNGQLGKQGGYTGCVFFKSSMVDENEIYVDDDKDINSAIDCGTDGGGCLEIYANASDAKKRDEYLASFDGTAFSSGSHKVVGTIVIRTSSKLKASEQQTLETSIVDALSKEYERKVNNYG